MTHKQGPDPKRTPILPPPPPNGFQFALPGYHRFIAHWSWGPRQAAAEAGPKPLAHPTNPADTTIDTNPTGPPATPERNSLP